MFFSLFSDQPQVKSFTGYAKNFFHNSKNTVINIFNFLEADLYASKIFTDFNLIHTIYMDNILRKYVVKLLGYRNIVFFFVQFQILFGPTVEPHTARDTIDKYD